MPYALTLVIHFITEEFEELHLTILVALCSLFQVAPVKKMCGILLCGSDQNLKNPTGNLLGAPEDRAGT